MKQCKPCITIRAVFKLAKLHWSNFMKDVKSYSSVNEVACKLKDVPAVKLLKLPEIEEVEKVRKLAQSNYIKDREGMFHFNDKDAVENLVKEYKTNGPKAV